MAALPDFDKLAFPASDPIDPTRAFPRVPPQGLTLLARLLQLDPARRPSAVAALRDEWFCLRPLPSDPSALPVPLRPLPGGARRRGKNGADRDGDGDGEGRGLGFGWSSDAEDEEDDGSEEEEEGDRDL